ncbi:hypothetical protein FA15DRAFT_705339 [Coprinopsis marcescibilis]|uniref:Fungal-type protein kinase domain-containing protein n=1 Tax=Coprinopsis marcescibilis TaxID=230819 RepID=A0A5C3KSX9_COPMA|nr:hypothetical protein FA15DRAFT_705339 [Coprinopsis marcescibilis]
MDANVDAYLAKTKLYKSEQCHSLPSAPKEERDIYEPMIAIIADIIRHFKTAEGDATAIPWLSAMMTLAPYETQPSKKSRLKLSQLLPLGLFVGQIFAHEDLCSVADFRPKDATSGTFVNRTKSRITMKKYGPTIESFRSVREVLWALHDALDGLTDERILHRDISVNNILLGTLGATEGWRGVLIDLDVAVRQGSLRIDAADHRTGTRIFQSLSALKSFQYPKTTHAHDHLDDFESFFYVLCSLLFFYVGPRQSNKPKNQLLGKWGNADATIALDSKSSFILKSTIGEALEKVSAFWGQTCMDLLDNFRGLICTIVDTKQRIREGETDITLEALRYEGVNWYNENLAHFKTAIAELAGEEAPEDSDEPPTLTLSRTTRTSRAQSQPTPHTNSPPPPPLGRTTKKSNPLPATRKTKIFNLKPAPRTTRRTNPLPASQIAKVSTDPKARTTKMSNPLPVPRTTRSSLANAPLKPAENSERLKTISSLGKRASEDQPDQVPEIKRRCSTRLSSKPTKHVVRT